MADFWQKKKGKKRGSLLLWSSVFALLGLLFLAPPDFLDSILFRLGFAGHFGHERFFNIKRQNQGLLTAVPSLGGASSLDLVVGNLQNLKKINWESRFGKLTSVSGLINPEKSQERPATVFLKSNLLPNASKGHSIEGDLLSWALDHGSAPMRVKSVFSKRSSPVRIRTPNAHFSQNFNNRSTGCLDGPSCALMQLSRAEVNAAFIQSPSCVSGACPSSMEYESNQLSSVFDGSDGAYQRLLSAVQSNSAPPLIHNLGVPLL